MTARPASANVSAMHGSPVRTPVEPPLGQRLAAHRFTRAQLAAADVIAVTLVTALAEFDLAPRVPGTVTGTAAAAAYAAIAAATVLRQWLPRTTLAIVLPATAAALALRSGVGAPVFVGMALYSVVTGSSRRLSLATASLAASAVLAGYVIGGGPDVIPQAIGGVPLVLLGWLAGENTRASRAYAAQEAERAAEHQAAVEAERADQVRRAVGDERAQIARELHDIVAHAMSLIAVRSGVARMVIDTDPGQAREALAIIETTTRRSLREMRLLVGMLRADDDQAELSSLPGLSDLGRLTAEVAAAGVAVDVHIDGNVTDLSPAADLSAYRIVQEALTNVVRHAGPTRARVQISYRPGEVGIDVTDDGPTGPLPPRAPRAGGGHGLIGMRERAALFGGELAAGPHAAGFRVQATLRTADLSAIDLPASEGAR
jgi:signal transduction histidine kinase